VRKGLEYLFVFCVHGCSRGKAQKEGYQMLPVFNEPRVVVYQIGLVVCCGRLVVGLSVCSSVCLVNEPLPSLSPSLSLSLSPSLSRSHAHFLCSVQHATKRSRLGSIDRFVFFAVDRLTGPVFFPWYTPNIKTHRTSESSRPTDRQPHAQLQTPLKLDSVPSPSATAAFLGCPSKADPSHGPEKKTNFSGSDKIVRPVRIIPD